MVNFVPFISEYTLFTVERFWREEVMKLKKVGQFDCNSFVLITRQGGKLVIMETETSTLHRNA